MQPPLHTTAQKLQLNLEIYRGTLSKTLEVPHDEQAAHNCNQHFSSSCGGPFSSLYGDPWRMLAQQDLLMDHFSGFTEHRLETTYLPLGSSICIPGFGQNEKTLLE